jgi:hypothetical protein
MAGSRAKWNAKGCHTCSLLYSHGCAESPTTSTLFESANKMVLNTSFFSDHCCATSERLWSSLSSLRPRGRQPEDDDSTAPPSGFSLALEHSGMVQSTSMQMLAWERTIECHSWHAPHRSATWPGLFAMATRWADTLFMKPRVDTQSGLPHPDGEQRETCSSPRTTERILSDDAGGGATGRDAGLGLGPTKGERAAFAVTSPTEHGLDGASRRTRLTPEGTTNLSELLPTAIACKLPTGFIFCGRDEERSYWFIVFGNESADADEEDANDGDRKVSNGDGSGDSASSERLRAVISSEIELFPRTEVPSIRAVGNEACARRDGAIDAICRPIAGGILPARESAPPESGEDPNGIVASRLFAEFCTSRHRDFE